MRHKLLEHIAQTLVIDAGVAPAAALGVAVRKPGGWNVYMGAAGTVSPHCRVDTTTLFDLASLTKPFLAVLCARLCQTGRLTWRTPIGALLPEVRKTPSENTPIELLLAHRAGLEPHLTLSDALQFRKPFVLPSALRRAAFGWRSDCLGQDPGTEHPPLYSDLGYILVGAGLERTMGGALDKLLQREVFGPLNLAIGSARQWLAHGGFNKRVAPTEHVRWRGTELRGVVHDDNCWALSGHTTCGHAGLFSSVEPMLQFGATMVDAVTGKNQSFLTRSTAGALVNERPGGSLRCGFDGKASDNAAAGSTAGCKTFGHLGYTGTSIWCDPDACVVSVLLTNRVNPTANNLRIREARPAVHEQLFQLGLTPATLESGWHGA